MTSGAPGTACDAGTGHCITCGDEGVEMRVIRADHDEAMCADEHSELHAVAVDLVGAVRPGDQVLVHAGVAIRHLGSPS